MKRHEPAGADNMVWIVTIAWIGLTAFILVLTGTIDNIPSKLLAGLRIGAGVMGLIAIIGLMARPLIYEISDKSVSVVRSWPLPRINIPKSEITEARHVKLGTLRPRPISLWWVFGYFGRFKSSEHGSVVICGSNPAHAAMISAKKKYVLTPANPKRFVNEVLGRK